MNFKLVLKDTLRVIKIFKTDTFIAVFQIIQAMKVSKSFQSSLPAGRTKNRNGTDFSHP